MPTYTYRCRDCKEEIEVVQKISDDPLTECPNCSGVLKRVFHPVGIIFKGSGFYSTDYGKSSKEKQPRQAAGKGEKGEKPTADKGPEKKAAKPKETV